jgi:adenine C2-methylase RlmN of 23S rRNA A2503 and tRNA A37
MTDTHRFKLSPNHLTLSTVGVVPRIVALAKDAPEVREREREREREGE